MLFRSGPSAQVGAYGSGSLAISGSGGNPIAADPSGLVQGHSGVAIRNGALVEGEGLTTIAGSGSSWLDSLAPSGFHSEGVLVEGATLRNADPPSPKISISGSGGSVRAGSPFAGSIGVAITRDALVQNTNGVVEISGSAENNLADDARSIGAAVQWGGQVRAASVSINGFADAGRAFGVKIGRAHV